jgi:hypothetical protein
MAFFKIHYKIIVTLITFLSIGSASASESAISVPENFTPYNIKKLDEAWVSPGFNASNYKTVAIQWLEFEYRPGKDRFEPQDRNENYELPAETKVRLEKQANEIFSKQLVKLKSHKLIDLNQADAETLIVQLNVTDFVNNLPQPRQFAGSTDFFLRQFGAATLNVTLIDGKSQKPLFKGYVRDNIQSFGFNVVRADIITANRRTKLQFTQWAKDLRKNINSL